MAKAFKLLAVTGIPGTGKTTIAKQLSLLLHYAYLDGTKLIKAANLAEGYDSKRKTSIVDSAKFARAALKVRDLAAKKGYKGAVLDSHFSHFLPRTAVKACIVLTCQLPELQRRLKRKGFSAAKIRENLDAEIFDTILVEAAENRHRVVKFDTTKATKNAIKRLASRIRKL